MPDSVRVFVFYSRLGSRLVNRRFNPPMSSPSCSYCVLVGDSRTSIQAGRSVAQLKHNDVSGEITDRRFQVAGLPMCHAVAAKQHGNAIQKTWPRQRGHGPLHYQLTESCHRPMLDSIRLTKARAVAAFAKNAGGFQVWQSVIRPAFCANAATSVANEPSHYDLQSHETQPDASRYCGSQGTAFVSGRRPHGVRRRVRLGLPHSVRPTYCGSQGTAFVNGTARFRDD